MRTRMLLSAMPSKAKACRTHEARREQGVDEDPPKGPDGALDPGLLRLAFETLCKAGHDPWHGPASAERMELMELLATVYTALAVQQRSGRPINDAVLDLIAATIRRIH